MSIAQKKDNEHSLHYLFPVFRKNIVSGLTCVDFFVQNIL
jgi:hypothetical protein